MLHCDGIQESGAFIDSSRVPHAVNVGGGTSVLATYIDNTQSVFGGFSANMVGNSVRFLTIPDHDDWNFGTGDFTIDFRLRISTLHTGANANYLFSQYKDASNLWYWRIFIRTGCPVAVTINAGGSGYAANQTLTIVQVGGSAGTLNIDSVDGGGAVTAVTINSAGTGYTTAGNPLATTVSPAGGTGCKINVITISPNMFQFYSVSGGVAAVNYSRGITPLVNTWYHFAFVRYGNIFSHYIDGVLSVSTHTTANSMPDTDSRLVIGQLNYTAGASIDGYADEIRISKGIARWTTDFTPPTMAYI
jgi:hypothetical protein